ncbi:hypothetical protein J007_04076 [Cryptococcus neoformans]|nr:hypothetical protein J007_04076 [Cryptococcus neoformans var. grubii]OXC60359.1 hypothetical protein C358_04193 [Cryptococcus neoformans var. grubii MW-RSA852]
MPPLNHISASSITALFSLVLSLSTPSLAVRQMTVSNKCSSSIYVAVGGKGGALTTTGGAAQPAGWKQAPGDFSFNVPDGWNNGRIWARTGCTLNGNTLDCVVGGCSGNTVKCSGTEYGKPGATLAEFTIDVNSMDSYDISIVDGYNLPMEITSSDSSCAKGSCGTETDILTQCDPSLVYPKNSDKIYSCNSACGNLFQFQDGTGGSLISADVNNSPVCCVQNGVAVHHVNCPNTYIPFYQTMKKMCHNAYVYSDDDMYEDAVFTCSSTGKPSYTITFCPNGYGAGLDPPSSSSAVSQDSTPGDNSGNLLNGSATVSIWTAITGTLIASDAGATAANGAHNKMNTRAASSVAVTAVTSVIGGQAMSESARLKEITSAAPAAATSSQDNSNKHTHNDWVAAIELATNTSAPAMTSSTTPKKLEESAATYTSNRKGCGS